MIFQMIEDMEKAIDGFYVDAKTKAFLKLVIQGYIEIDEKNDSIEVSVNADLDEYKKLIKESK